MNTTDNTEFTSYKPTDNQPQFRLPPNCRYIECEDRKTAELAFAQLAIRPTAQDHIRDLHDAATRFEDRAKQAEAQRDAAVAALRDLTRVIRIHGGTKPRSAVMENAYAAIALTDPKVQHRSRRKRGAMSIFKRTTFYAFLLGVIEFRSIFTTSLSGYQIEAYDSGRELAHKLTLRAFDL